MKIIAKAPAPIIHGKAQTVWERHCFVCHCFIQENVFAHQNHHQLVHDTELTARSETEARKMIDLLEINLGAHIVKKMNIWCDNKSE